MTESPALTADLPALYAPPDWEGAFARELNMRLLLERVLSRQETRKA